MRLLAFMVVILACTGLASGHDLNTLYAPGVGARAMGMGGAFVAASGDPSCIYWNPAGLAGIRKPTASLEGWRMWGWSEAEKYFDLRSSSYKYGSVEHSGLGLGVVAWPFSMATVSAGTYIPYENSLWGETFTWRGRTVHKGMESRVLRSAIAAATMIPIFRQGKLALGLEVFDDRLRYRKTLSPYTASGLWAEYVLVDWRNSKLQGGGYGVQTGLLFQPEDALAIGLAVEKRGTLDATGTTEAYYYESYPDSFLIENTYWLPTALSTPLPTLFKLGIRLHQEPLTFEWDTQFASESPRSSLTPYSWQGLTDPGIRRVATPFQRMGAELKVVPGVFIRGGAYFDFGSEIDEPLYLTYGLGVERWGFKADGAVERLFSKGAHELITRGSLGLTYALGK